MTGRLHRRRRNMIAGLGICAGVLALTLMLGAALEGGGGRRDARTGQPVLAGFQKAFSAIDRVIVTLPDDRYALERRADGGWGMADSGGYPVRAEALAALFDGLADMTYERARTADPDKFDRLGLGDPLSGGTGARIEILAGQNRIADLIAGRRRERTYVRLAGDERAWRVEGDLPPLYARAGWLDLKVVSIAESEIASVAVTLAPDVSPSYEIAKAGDGASGFVVLAPEGGRLTSRFAATGPGLALTRFAPLDVDRIDALDLSRVGTHRTRLVDGRAVALFAFTDALGRGWVTVQFEGDGAAAANQRTNGWAFRLAPQDFAEVMTPRAAVIAAPPGEAK